ncbi:MAG: GNAT family N-acetyltransferase [Fibrella sp.]|nr:GNAT family N-acetyltransferase [Armatimonadota bacterium]
MDASKNAWSQRETTETAPIENAGGTILIRAGGRRVDITNALKVRDVVFVQEQNVPVELEHDEFDADALHILAIETKTKEPVGTARVLDKGDGVAKIGRVAVLKEYRGRGIGQALMQAVFKTTRELNFTSLLLDAQVSVIPFYENLGFVAEGGVFDDAGIPHRRMSMTL